MLYAQQYCMMRPPLCLFPSPIPRRPLSIPTTITALPHMLPWFHPYLHPHPSTPILILPYGLTLMFPATYTAQVFRGHAGWSPRQLEGGIRRHAHPPPPSAKIPSPSAKIPSQFAKICPHQLRSHPNQLRPHPHQLSSRPHQVKSGRVRGSGLLGQ